MNHLEPLPVLLEGLLDPDMFDQYFSELLTHAENVTVLEKRIATEYVVDSTIDLASARDNLRTGAVRAIQIRYSYDGQDWCDTLLAQAERVKLIRMEQA